jgi:hypothetical protein
LLRLGKLPGDKDKRDINRIMDRLEQQLAGPEPEGCSLRLAKD